jgi:hypothetical protein
MPPSDLIVSIEESATERGWSFSCVLADGRRSVIRLDWADYDYWCPGGQVTPERIAEAVLATMLAHGQPVTDSFDAARVRHVIPEADDHIWAMTGR